MGAERFVRYRLLAPAAERIVAADEGAHPVPHQLPRSRARLRSATRA